MRTYEEMTAPVVEHYHGMARFAEVNGDLPVGDITRAITDAIVRLRS
jgi:adenylate kinase